MRGGASNPGKAARVPCGRPFFVSTRDNSGGGAYPSMIEELEKLIVLQRNDLEIRAIESRLKQIPVEVENLEKEVATEKANVEKAEQRLSESQKSRRSMEGELEMIESRISKYKEQLMQVKSNDEYRAMQKQIDIAKEDLSAKEDLILAKFDEAESLQTKLSHRKKELEIGMVEVGKQEAELEKERTKLNSELHGKKTERAELIRLIPEELLNQYHVIAHARGGIGVAEAKNEHCQECHVRLRPQVYEELRLGQKILKCDSCTRILYIADSEEGQKTEEASSSPS
jgi:predicted  nucleic acid-binding Zn-ribbon protein